MLPIDYLLACCPFIDSALKMGLRSLAVIAATPVGFKDTRDSGDCCNAAMGPMAGKECVKSGLLASCRPLRPCY